MKNTMACCPKRVPLGEHYASLRRIGKVRDEMKRSFDAYAAGLHEGAAMRA
jgi:hypothetical protein